jgi:L,D-transpeptidase-like protein
MTPDFSKSKRKPARMRSAHLAIAGLAMLIAAQDHAAAKSRANERAIESVASRAAGEPILAIVSLQSQHITIYDANGWMLRAPVSSGQKGRETPAGIFSVLEKEAEHYSNLYDDAFMPHMQRITWSGIALHGGVLPGHPASHGCIRLPYDFAEHLFDLTRPGLRVIVAPTDVAPVEIAHPLLPQSRPGAGAQIAARTAEADEASRKADQARRAAGAAFRESTQAMGPLRIAENLKHKAEAQLAAAEAALASASSDEARQQAEDDKAKAAARIAELDAQWAAAKAEQQKKLDALAAARETVAAADTARTAAAEAARQAARELEPMSVLISRKTQRLYIRQGFEPIYEGPVTIQDPDRPIGTHIFTAMELATGGPNMRWSVVSLHGHPQAAAIQARGGTASASRREAEPAPAEPETAQAALDRIVIPQEALDRIGGMMPRSSFIVTDEGLSSETGKRTDFVVVLSGEPQGGIKFRRRGPAIGFGYARSRTFMPFGRSPFGGSF